jgi:hypothetical protein
MRKRDVAVAGRVSALRAEDYFRKRASRADVRKAKQILRSAGDGTAPCPGDEL